ncbi:MAG TPA: hypothetical protein VFK43_14150 [Acidimicrobiales bacterium]|nr:hypothetical protein [Acidimicrobiales bacterium]
MPAARLRPVQAVLAVVILVTFVAGVRGAVRVHTERGDRLDPSTAAVIAELQAFVEVTRGLRFREPVDVSVVSDAAFRRFLSGGKPADRADVEVTNGVLRALGLLAATDTQGPSGELDPDTVAGFYDTETKELVVRGTQLTPFVRQVLVHELTHALDDQYFDLDPALVDDEAAMAFEALVEGDAVVVEGRYLASLPEAERRAAAAEEDATFGDAGRRIPGIVAELGAFPYRDGPRLVAALLAAGGPGRLDAAFRSPPVSSAEVLHPERFLDGPGRATVPPVRAEGRVIDHGVLGEVILRLVLAGSLPRDRAAVAAAGWAGDSYVAWSAGGRTCLRATVVMDNAAEVAELVAGLRQWAGATVDPATTRPPAVTFTRCA